MMKFSLYIPNLYILTSFVFVISCGNKSMIDITPQAIILENLEVGTWVTKKILLKNWGTKTIRKVRVSSTCGCTVTSGVPSEIGPGEEIEFPVHFRAPDKPENFKQDILVGFEDKHISIPIIGNSTQTLFVKPSMLRIGISDTIRHYAELISIESYRQPISKIIPSFSENVSRKLINRNFLQVKLSQLKENHFLLTFSCDAFLAADIFPVNDILSLNIEFENDEKKVIGIPFLVEKKNKIVVMPSIINFKFENQIHSWKSNILSISSPIKINQCNLSIHGEKESVSVIRHSLNTSYPSDYQDFLCFQLESKNNNVRFATSTLSCDGQNYTLPVVFNSIPDATR